MVHTKETPKIKLSTESSFNLSLHHDNYIAPTYRDVTQGDQEHATGIGKKKQTYYENS